MEYNHIFFQELGRLAAQSALDALDAADVDFRDDFTISASWGVLWDSCDEGWANDLPSEFKQLSLARQYEFLKGYFEVLAEEGEAPAQVGE